jgi:thiol-disulfide isomerase/thioredoxin
LVLTDQNVHEAFLEHDMMIVKYYAPWCHHCKALMPEWEHAAFFLSDHIPFAKVYYYLNKRWMPPSIEE